MMIVGIDSSTDILALGIYDNDTIEGEININLGQGHNKRLLPYLDMILQETGYEFSDIEGFSLVTGPGSFTGLRISLSTIKAFNLAKDFKTIGVSSLELLVSAYIDQPGFWLPVFDARSSRVYTALFAGGNRLPDKNSRLLSDRAEPLEELPGLLSGQLNPGDKLTIVGPGVKIYQEELQKQLSRTNLQINIATSSPVLPAGGRLAWLGSQLWAAGREDDIRDLSPRYLKKSQAELDYSKEEGEQE